MVGMMARDFEGWMKKMERDVLRAQRAPIAIVGNAIEVVRGEVVQITTRRPTAPIELTYQTGAYQAAAGYPAVRFIMDFPDVTMATDGNPIVIDHYELWGRDVTPGLLSLTTSAVPGLAAPGLTAPGLAKTFAQQQAENAAKDTTWLRMGTSPVSGFRIEDMVPGSVWEFKARAIGLNAATPGLYSATITAQMVKDTTPPPQPTAPVVLSDRGVLRITHDGQSVAGAMPADFSYFVLAQGDAADPTNEVARFGRVGGVYVAAGLEYYKMQYFRVKAVDESGNEGPWSAVAFGFTEPMVDKDIILSELDAAQTLIKNIDGGVSIKDGTVVTRNLYVTEDMTAALAQFLKVKADMIDANELWADEAFFGVADAYLVRSDMFVGKQFEGGVFTTTLGGKFQTNVEDLKGVKVRETGISAYNSNTGEKTFDLDALTGNVVATGVFQTSPTGVRAMLWDHGGGIAAVDLFPSTGDQHGALFSEPTAPGTRGGFQTNIQHYTDLGNYSAYVSLAADGSWTIGAFSSTVMFAKGPTGSVTLDARSLTGTENDINLWSRQGDLFLYTESGNGFLSAPGGSVTLTSSNSMMIDGGSGNITIAGKMGVVGGISNGTFYVWKSSSVTTSAQVWNMTYQNPVPSGIRWPFLTVTASDSMGSAVDLLTTSGFQAVTRTISGASALHHIRWIAPWMTQL